MMLDALSALQPSQGAYQHRLFCLHILFGKMELLLAAPDVAFRSDLLSRLPVFHYPDQSPFFRQVFCRDDSSGAEVESVCSHSHPWVAAEQFFCVGQKVGTACLAFDQGGGAIDKSIGLYHPSICSVTATRPSGLCSGPPTLLALSPLQRWSTRAALPTAPSVHGAAIRSKSRLSEPWTPTAYPTSRASFQISRMSGSFGSSHPGAGLSCCGGATKSGHAIVLPPLSDAVPVRHSRCSGFDVVVFLYFP